jgi:hypothetical protein
MREKAKSNQYTKGSSVETKRFTVRMPADVMAQFAANCLTEGRSMSEVATREIARYNQYIQDDRFREKLQGEKGGNNGNA